MQDDITSLRITVDDGSSVSALLQVPRDAFALLVLAHGAGAGMHHAFMGELAGALAGCGVATLRFQFPFMESGRKRPDDAPVAQRVIRAAVAAAAERGAGLPLFAGGKSFGGRMTSQAQAAQPLDGVRGLVFFGFPLHPAGKPGTGRAAHLAQVRVPMLFLQGTRDVLADLELMRSVVSPLGAHATLHGVDGADHAFHVLVRSGRTDTQVVQELAGTAARWMRSSFG
jgi:uncharacterized protein